MTHDATGNAYLGSDPTLDPGTSNATQTKSDQTLDAYGNIQASHVYDYGNLSSPSWTYNYTADSNYTSRYIRNRVTNVYNPSHQVTQRTDAKGQQTQYTYDAYGRLAEVRHYTTGGQEDPNQRWDYNYDGYTTDSSFTVQNGLGRLTQVTFGGLAGGGSYLYSYNQAGRVTTQRLEFPWGPHPFNFDATYGWDNEGRMTSLGYPRSGPVYAYGFDSMGRLSTMQENGAQMATAGYNFASQMTSLAYDALTESRTYDPVTLQLKRITATQSPSTTVMDISYNYTAGQNNGRISSSTDGMLNETVNHTYDALNRLSTAQATSNAWGQAFTTTVMGT